MAKYNIGRSLRAALRGFPKLPAIDGDAFVLGSAPDPVIPPEILQSATIVTANASQLVLEAHGIAAPHITCMRASMADQKDTSVMKLKKLRGRRTGLLVLFPLRHDPQCLEQRRVLAEHDYRYDDLLILHRLDCSSIYNRLLTPGPLHRVYEPSMGLRSVLYALAAGADRVALGGISFRQSGCAFSDLDYARIHIDTDTVVVDAIRARGLPVYPTDAAMAEDAGLPQWPTRQGQPESAAQPR